MQKRTNTAKWSDKYKRWQINVQREGKRKSFYSSTKGRKGQREANSKADKWLEYGISSDIKISELQKIMIEEKWQMKEIGSSRYARYKSIYNCWVSKIGNKKMSELTEQDIQQVLNTAYKKGKSQGTIKEIKSWFNELCKYGRKRKITTLVPIDLYIPKQAKKLQKRNTLTDKEINILFSSDIALVYDVPTKDDYIYTYRFACVTGLRRGELIGLQWKDFKQIDNHTIMEIKRSINENREVTEGKTENAKRNQVLPNIANKILKQQRELLKANKIISAYVFPDLDTGDFITPDKLTRRFNNYVKYNNLNPKITLHWLRHTFFTNAYSCIEERILKKIGGHAKKMDTSIYVHETYRELINASEKIEAVFRYIIK
ncbi:tyrosine-type recombinase/integrase [Anaerofustis sp.]|uniref:tyrosine-type recombinase/integrase n=1 Tax=Anaerofustis sp. TaxID=1872517 RepID=UPI0025BA6C5D|nr:tyrosine-type recombinase/integrase [Anaerofustis sp.]